jgi:hypothetical protein
MSTRLRIWGLAAAIDFVLFAAVVIVLIVTGGDGLNGDTGNGQMQGNSELVGHRAPHYQTYLVNNSGGPVTIESATLIALPGQRTPTLAARQGVELYPGDITRGRPWMGARLARMHGFVLRAGGDAYIDYALYADKPGFYGAAGLRLTVKEGSSIDTVDAIAGDALCVYSRRVPRRDGTCSRLGNAVMNTVGGM